MNIIWALVKKDFRFNWIVSVFLAPCFLGLLFIESIDDGISNEEQYLFLACFAGVVVMPTIYSMQKEGGDSTKQFLSALPIRTRDVILSKAVTTAIYSVLIVPIYILCNSLWNFGFTSYHFIIGSIMTLIFFTGYVCCHYLKSNELAQMFIFLILASHFILLQYKGDRIANLFFLSDMPILMTVLTVAVICTLAVVILIVKKKRRL